jgi:hypothetical protein
MQPGTSLPAYSAADHDENARADVDECWSDLEGDKTESELLAAIQNQQRRRHRHEKDQQQKEGRRRWRQQQQLQHKHTQQQSLQHEQQQRGLEQHTMADNAVSCLPAPFPDLAEQQAY